MNEQFCREVLAFISGGVCSYILFVPKEAKGLRDMKKLIKDTKAQQEDLKRTRNLTEIAEVFEKWKKKGTPIL